MNSRTCRPRPRWCWRRAARCCPAHKILETTQDRLIEKDFVKKLGIGTADYADVSSAESLRAAIARIGLPAVIKTRRFGYDGKGQAIIREGDDLDQVWEDLGTRSAILEAFVPFEREISVIAARSVRRPCRMLRRHRKRASRPHPENFAGAGRYLRKRWRRRRASIAEKIASALNYVGVLAVEMFVVPADGGPKVLVNEIAPRVHNSGHWTLDGASISQFEQHIRAIAGWPLGKPVRHGPVTMTNLIGDDIIDYERWLTVPGATVHLYGKGPPRPGRKMGHVTAGISAPARNSRRCRPYAGVLPSTTPAGSSLEPAIDHAAQRAADQRRDPEQPELRQRPAADEQRRPGAARRVDRGVGDGNADQVDHHQRQGRWRAAQSPPAPCRGSRP